MHDRHSSDSARGIVTMEEDMQCPYCGSTQFWQSASMGQRKKCKQCQRSWTYGARSAKVACPRCHGEATRKNGSHQGTQQYYCADCQRSWLDGRLVQGVTFERLCRNCGQT